MWNMHPRYLEPWIKVYDEKPDDENTTDTWLKKGNGISYIDKCEKKLKENCKINYWKF